MAFLVHQNQGNCELDSKIEELEGQKKLDVATKRHQEISQGTRNGLDQNLEFHYWSVAACDIY